jgi:hypothetical protein
MAGLVPAIQVMSFRRKPESSSAERAKKKLDPGFRRGDVDARHVRLVLGPAKPDPSAGHDSVGGW